MLKIICFLSAFFLLLGCSQDQSIQQGAQASPTTPGTRQTATPSSAEHLLVFFINPDGGPCRMQDEILSRMSGELEGKVLIRPVQTTVQADRELFYAYGIRALPTILLADATGKELKRLPPGVQPVESIRSLLTHIPAN